MNSLPEKPPVQALSLSAPPPPAIRAEGLLRSLENIWLRADHLIGSFLPPHANPLGQLGAIANGSLIIAVLSGVALLTWYTPSVHQAYDSLEKIGSHSFLGQLARSIHRYSSDGCLFFVLMHAARIGVQRRFTGSRWLPWVTGVLLLTCLWFIGWTGYWLVWDVRGQHAALGTVRFIDRLPIFSEPLSRSFLTDESVPSLLFFLIFFAHMLTPLALGIGVWMHLMRVNRARFLPSRAMWCWIVGSILALSLLLPATSAARAQMTVKSLGFRVDGWYLWPFALTDRLRGGALWAFFLAFGMAGLTAPWWMVKRLRSPEWKAKVDLPRCMGCTLCAHDCPFNAITMVARDDGRRFALQSEVNPDLCVGCGICVGSCDSQAINLPAQSSRQIEHDLSAWIDQEKAAGATPFIALCCAESGGALRTKGLEGYRVQSVPCSGWISAVLMERLIQRGAAGLLVVGCGEVDPVGREGMKWFNQRMEGRREPKFDPAKADPARVRFARSDRTQRRDLERIAAEFRAARNAGTLDASKPTAHPGPESRVRLLFGGIGVSVVLCAVTFLGSRLPYRTPHSPMPELVISFNHHGALTEPRKLTKEELAKRLPHMRAQVNVTRERVPVRLRIQLDGQILHDHSYPAKGLSHDGPSVAVARLPVQPGSHLLAVDIADSADLDKWTQHWSQSVNFETNRIRVLLFDSKVGFSLE